MLYGRTEPGGVINIVRKQPLYTAYRAFEGNIGSYGQYRAVGDLFGPIGQLAGGETAYRLVVAGEKQGYWRTVGHDMRNLLIAPSLGWRGDKVQLVPPMSITTAPRRWIAARSCRTASPSRCRQSAAFRRISRAITASAVSSAAISITRRPTGSRGGRAAYMNYLTSNVQVNASRLNAQGDLTRFVLANRRSRQENTYLQETGVATFATGQLKHELLFGAAQGEVSDDSSKGVFLPSASLLYRLTDRVSVYARTSC